MKKNVGSQVIGAQMITAADGTAFTGAVSVFVTGDGGTQGAGGGAAPAHEGNGFHSYTPTQAETNFDHIAFTFTGTGAIPCTVQVYTTFPQTGDSFARLGAPAGASISADIATIDTNVDAILVDTGTSLPADIAALPTATENADALLNRDMSAVSDTNARSPLNALRFLRNKWSAPAGTLTVTKEDDTTTAWTSALTSDAAANPITGSDPA